jgi:diaminopimelate epimerase
MTRSISERKIAAELGHTCRNHFVMLDLRPRDATDWNWLVKLAQTFCEAPIADDMLVLLGSSVADARLQIVGGDGREADFCGNGMIYVAAKLGYELGRDEVTIENRDRVTRAVRQNAEWKIEVGPVSALSSELKKVPRDALAGCPVRGLLRAGEPHLVLNTPKELGSFHVTRQEVEAYCRPLRNITAIEGGVNVTIVFSSHRNSVLIRTYERGARRHTLSCGTGAVSAIASVFGIPKTPREFRVCAPGGAHRVGYRDGIWYLAASPQPIARGYLELDVLHLPLSGMATYDEWTRPGRRPVDEMDATCL